LPCQFCMKDKKMPPLKIGIVEDEGLIAESIMLLLQGLGYDALEPAADFAEAIRMMEHHRPDLVILDINLGENSRDGIELAEHIKAQYAVPFIYLTANADQATVERAKNTEPAAFLIKPFTKANLYATIEVVFAKHTPTQNYLGHAYVFLKDGTMFRKVFETDVLYVESDHVYLNIHTRSRKYLLRSTVDAFFSQLSPERFMKVSRSFIVNVHHISAFTNDHVEIEGNIITVSKSHRKEFMERMQAR
jgi:DNA-binding LytR/AlgR family response regulator